MRLTTKSRYGLRALFDIAYNCGNQPAQIQDISRRQGISPRYLEQIFQTLKKAGILTSKRGPQGGYCLARTADKITVLDILNATEQDVLLVDCVGSAKKTPKRQADCPFEGQCVTQSIWEDANELLNNLFAGITLQNLCERGHNLGIKKEQDHRFMYYI